MIQHFYVIYDDTIAYPYTIRLIDQAQFETCGSGYATDGSGLYCSKVYSDSTREDDPLINTLVMTQGRINAQRAAEIEQEVVDWLMDNGHIPKRI